MKVAGTLRFSPDTSLNYTLETSDITGDVTLPAGTEMVMPGDTLN